MKLSRIALMAIKGACPGIVDKLSDAGLGSRITIYRYIRTNDDNLTKAVALKIIREATGLSDEQILEDEAVSNVG